MKLAKRILLGAMAAVALVGCKDDPISSAPEAPGTPDSNEPGVYFSLKIDLPNAAGSRSVTDEPGDNGSTSNSGVEIGQDYENTVNDAIIVLANASETDKAVMNGFIAAASINTGDLTALKDNHSSYKAQSMFSKGDLSSFYEKIGTENVESPDNIMANIFVFCNPTQNMKDQLLGNAESGIKAPEQNTNDWLLQFGSIISTSATGTTSIWWKNSFLMSNAILATREIPGNTVGWNEYTSADNPFHLSENNKGGINNGTAKRGSIKVERACARFDFRDGSNNNFTYDVLSVEGEPDEQGNLPSVTLIQVQLQKMFLVNQSKSFYYLPHVVDPVALDGSSIVGVTTEQLKDGVCVPELPWNFNDKGGYTAPYGNYVADYNLEWKNSVYNSWGPSGDKKVDDFATYFNYPFFNSDGSIDNTDNTRWEEYLCSEVVKGEPDDNPDSWNAAGNLPRYHIWCYTGENTIPSIEGQINAVSTGVVFKAKYSSPYPTTDLESDNFVKRNNAMVAQAVNNSGEVSKDDPVIYMFSKVLYCGWENIQQAAIYAAGAEFVFNQTGEETGEDGNIYPVGTWELKDGKINRTNSLYKAVFGTGGVGSITFKYHVVGDDKTYTATWDDPEEIDENCANMAWKAWVDAGQPDNGEVNEKFKKAVTGAEITIYQRSYDKNYGNGYYCYYYYWNRHNNNGINGVMGPMEFAVVRNNVYKLAVTKINQLGHPRISENDPNKPGPRTPDEDESVYLDVITEILPWVVRINEIEF